MATPTLSNNIVQIVGQDESIKRRVFNMQGLKRLIHDHCKDLGAHYPVYSIIGAQGSGKSTLMNNMFNMNFRTLNQEIEGRRATTKGIWAAICNVPKAVVLDIEGFDSEEQQDDTAFQNQSAMFALMISDVIIFNIDMKDIGRNHGASIPILQIIFEECVKREDMKETKLVFTVRDYNNKTPVPVLLAQQLSSLEKLWKKQLTDVEVQTLAQYFGKPSMEVFPNFEDKKEEFQNKCKAVIDKWSAELSCRGPNTRAVCHFPYLSEHLWEIIGQNKKLDIPSFQAMVSQVYCEHVMSDITTDLINYNELLSKGGQENPNDFYQRLKQVIGKVNSTYDDKTKHEDSRIATKIKETLMTWINQEVEKNIQDAMSKFKYERWVKAATKITDECQKTVLDKEGTANSIVNRYIVKFKLATKDLTKDRKDWIEKETEDFETRIKLIGVKLLEVAVKQTCWDAAQVLSIGVGHAALGGAAGIAGVATGAISLATLAGQGLSYSAVEGINNTLEASPAKLHRAKDRVLSEVIGNGADSDGKYSAQSSSSSK